MHKEHPEFVIEKTRNLPYWRYMDLWKFLDLLNTSQLFFPNVEMLGDQHEGKIPEKIYRLMLDEERQNGATNNAASNLKWFIEKRLRPKTLICSWIANEKESFAMWKMYSKDKLGVAIKTNYDRLKDSFNQTNENIYIGEVRYYDDNKPAYKIGNTFYTFLVKHNYYDFESEVRCITEIKTEEMGETFKKIKVELNTLIEDVYISPFSSQVGFVEIQFPLIFLHGSIVRIKKMPS